MCANTKDKQGKTIEDVAAEQWPKLVKHFKNYPKRKEGEGEETYWRDREKELHAVIEPLVERIMRDSPIVGVQIGLGIIQLNSQMARRRMKLPIWGNGTSKRLQKRWKMHVWNGDSRELMFRDPSKPNHLLTEFMWRLQRSEEIGKGCALSLFLTTQDPLHAVASKDVVGRTLVCSEQAPDTLSNMLQNATSPEDFVDGLGLNDITVKEFLWDRMNQWLKAVRKDAMAYLKGFEYSGDTKSPLFKRLIEPPLKTLWEMGRAVGNDCSPPTNVFYLPDIMETEEVGGLTFEIRLDQKANEIPTDGQLHEFLRDAQWKFSQYVIQPITAAERNHALRGDTYKETHFSGDGLADLQQRIRDAKKKVKDDVAKEAIQIIERHFANVGNDIGSYWRGYPRQAFETACTVASLYDLLFVKVDSEKVSDRVRASGVGFEGLFDSKLPLPRLIRQLFRGLKAENELFLTPFYREHFIHSFHCFSIGIVLLAWGEMTALPTVLVEQFRSKTDVLCLLKRWFLVAMWHDVAYSLQKGHELLEGYVTDFLDADDRGKRCRGLIPWHPSVGHLLQAKGLIDGLRDMSKGAMWVSPKLQSQGINADDLALLAALDRVDHGVWSALFFGHVFKDVMWEGVERDEVMRAILVHHIAEWGLKSRLKDFDLNETTLGYNTRKAFEVAVGKGEHVCVYRDGAPEKGGNSMGCLLFLSDMLSQLGREAPDLGGRAPSQIGIWLDAVGSGVDENGKGDRSLVFRLRYKKYPLDVQDMMKEYFMNLVPFFGLACDLKQFKGRIRIELVEGEVKTPNDIVSVLSIGDGVKNSREGV